MKVSTQHITHLLELIDDPNEAIVNHVASKIVEQGEEILPELEDRLMYNTSCREASERLNSIINEIKFISVQKSVEEWRKSTNKDLLEGIYNITKLQFPEINLEDLKQAIQALKKEIWLELNQRQTSFERIKIFNQIFFNYLNFSVTPIKKATPFDYFLPTVFQQQEGSEMSLGIIYSLVAQELNLPIYGVIYPFNRFLLAYLDTNNILSMLGLHSESNGILCYINVSNKGEVVQKNELDKELNDFLIQPTSSYYEPAPNTLVVKKYVEHIYKAFLCTPALQQKANYYSRLLKTLS